MRPRPSLLAAALLALASLGHAQDPPPDLLKHVKVGQRWTFSTTMGEFRTEEVWHVAEVDAEERWVSYVLTQRTSNHGKLVTEVVTQELQRWSGGTKAVIDAPVLLAMKATQSRKTYECAGAKLDALVIATQGPTEQWTSVRGDFDTFPGVLKVVADTTTVRALEKVEEGPPPVVPTPPPEEVLEGDSNLPKGALDHVKVGQRWCFKATANGVESQLVWKVTAVEAAQGLVRYDVTMTMKGEDGTTIPMEPQPDQEWQAGAVPVLPPGQTVAGVSGERKPLTVPGLTLECYVITTDLGAAKLQVWSAVKGNREVFPGMVKQIAEGGGLELLRVEGP